MTKSIQEYEGAKLELEERAAGKDAGKEDKKKGKKSSKKDDKAGEEEQVLEVDVEIPQV